MHNDSCVPLEEVRQFLESDTPVELTRVQDWLATEDKENLGAIYAVLSERSTRIYPESQSCPARHLTYRLRDIKSAIARVTPTGLQVLANTPWRPERTVVAFLRDTVHESGP
jgi:hypothetical protein